MSEKTARVRLKMGQLEVEYEGDPAFLGDGLNSLLDRVADFYTKNKNTILQDQGASAGSTGGKSASAGGKVGGAGLHQSTNTIATHLGAKSGPDLAMAAAANLALVQGLEKFTRKELLAEMQGATTFFKDTMSGNLTKILATLCKNNRLNLVAADTYALPAGERQSLETKLAQ